MFLLRVEGEKLTLIFSVGEFILFLILIVIFLCTLVGGKIIFKSLGN